MQAKTKRQPVVQVSIPKEEVKYLNEIARVKHTSLSAVVRELTLNSNEYQHIKGLINQRGQ